MKTRRLSPDGPSQHGDSPARVGWYAMRLTQPGGNFGIFVFVVSRAVMNIAWRGWHRRQQTAAKGDDMIDRVVVWFSAGVTSAVALKLALDRYRDELPVVAAYCDTGSEHEDNARFMRDVEQWLGVTVEVLRNEKYIDTMDVYRQVRYIVGTAGARCTYELKKLPRRQFERLATDLQVFGYDAGERGRAQRFMDNNPEVNAWFPLVDENITKDDARHILKLGGIQEPITYSLGFNNANCLRTGCVKGGMGYWNHMRRVFPDAFWRMAALEREIGHAICAHEKRGPDGERMKVPVYLDELDPTAGNYNTEPAFQCGLFCGQY